MIEVRENPSVLEKVAKAMSRNYGIQVKFSGNGAATNCKTITLPSLPQDIDPAFESKIRGYCDHEVGHVLYSDPHLPTKLHAENPALRTLTNLIEDVRIERLLGEKYAGARANMMASTNELLKQYHGEEADVSGNVPMMLSVELKRQVCGHTVAGPSYKEAIEKAFGPDIFDYVRNAKSSADSETLARRILKEFNERELPPPPPQEGEGDPEEKECNGGKGPKEKGSKPKRKSAAPSEGGEAEAEKKPKPKRAPKEEPKEGPTEGDDDDEGEGEDEGEGDINPGGAGPKMPAKPGSGSGSGKAAGEGEEEEGEGPEPDGEGEEGEGEEPEGEGEEEGEGEPESEGEGEGEGEGSPADRMGGKVSLSMGKEDGSEGGGGSPEGEALPSQGTSPLNGNSGPGGPGVEDIVDQFNEFVPMPDKLREEILKSVDELARGEKFYRPFSLEDDELVPVPVRDASTADELFEEMKKSLGSLTASKTRIAQMFQAKTQAKWMTDQDRGKINNKALARMKAGNMKVFKKKVVSQAKDTAAALLVDMSGSMSGYKVRSALATVIFFLELLDLAGVKSEVLGFTTGDYPAAYYDSERRGEVGYGSGAKFSRYERLVIYEYKGFGEPYSLGVKRRIGAGLRCRMANNIDGESVLVAYRRLKMRKEKRKILFVLSDGYPAGHGNGSQLIGHLHRVCKMIDDDPTVELIGIGYGDDSVKRFYKNHILVPDISKIGETMNAELRKLLLDGLGK